MFQPCLHDVLTSMEHGHFIWGAMPVSDTVHAWDSSTCMSQPCPVKKKKICETREQEELNTFSQYKESIHALIVALHSKIKKYSYSWFVF